MKISPTQSDFLNFSRWTAAWLVLAEHVRALVFSDYAACNPGLWWRPFYFLTGFGHEAVMIFFVISGYLVGGKVVAGFRNGKFQWRKYLVDRVSRLYAVLLVALLLGGVWDWIGLHYANGFGLYDGTAMQPVAVVTKNVSDDLNAFTLVANAGFLQTVTVPTFGSNGPLWSLANEWWYYLLFPLCLMVVNNSAWWLRVVSCGLILALVWWLPFSMLLLGGVWLFGVIIALSKRRWLPWPLAMALTIAVLIVARLEVIQAPLAMNVIIGLCYGLSLNSLVNSERRFPLHAVSLTLADFSYSLYLLHFPLVLLLLSVMYTYGGFGLKMSPSGVSVLVFCATCLLAITGSWLTAGFTEARTPWLRDRMYALTRVPIRTATSA